VTLPSEQKPPRKPRKQTNVKERLDNLYKKVQKSAINGQKPTYQSLIEKKRKGMVLDIDSGHRIWKPQEEAYTVKGGRNRLLTVPQAAGWEKFLRYNPFIR